MQQLLQLSNVNMEQIQTKLCPGVQHSDTCTGGRVFREWQYHRWGWGVRVTERLPRESEPGVSAGFILLRLVMWPLLICLWKRLLLV